jgi:hypothetical protein
MTDEPDDLGDDVLAEFNDIAAGDSAQAQQLRTALERLRSGAGGPELQEMARDVLAGRVSLRAAFGFSFYQEALARRLDERREEQDPRDQRDSPR